MFPNFCCDYFADFTSSPLDFYYPQLPPNRNLYAVDRFGRPRRARAQHDPPTPSKWEGGRL